MPYPPYLALMGELWDAFCRGLEKNDHVLTAMYSMSLCSQHGGCWCPGSYLGTRASATTMLLHASWHSASPHNKCSMVLCEPSILIYSAASLTTTCWHSLHTSLISTVRSQLHHMSADLHSSLISTVRSLPSRGVWPLGQKPCNLWCQIKLCGVTIAFSHKNWMYAIVYANHTLGEVTWDDVSRVQSVHAPSQWEMTLHCNVVDHLLGTYTKWSLIS